MTDESSKSALSFNDFLKTFFCTRSLWIFYGFFWAATLPILLFWAISLPLPASYHYFVFAILCVPLAIGFLLYKKKNPDFLSKTAHRQILESGTPGQKLGVFFFLSLFGGPLGWGAAVVIGLKIYDAVSGNGDLKFGEAMSAQVLMISLAFGAFMAASFWIECLRDTKKKTMLKVAGIVLFVAYVLLEK